MEPYLPMTFSELKTLLEDDGIVDWPTHRLRILGEFQTQKLDCGTRVFSLRNHELDVMPSEDMPTTRPERVNLQLDFTYDFDFCRFKSILSVCRIILF